MVAASMAFWASATLRPTSAMRSPSGAERASRSCSGRSGVMFVLSADGDEDHAAFGDRRVWLRALEDHAAVLSGGRYELADDLDAEAALGELAAGERLGVAEQARGGQRG